jgi:ubiquinone/menaquinone biosynthesis C-methylase UbiE
MGKKLMARKPAAETARNRYDRMARLYDMLEWPIEHLRFASWRLRFKDRIRGDRVLEVGVGTGKNLPYYPEDLDITALDLSPRMLDRARARAAKIGSKVELLEMDVEQLDFADHYFDTIFATFVFCSVPDPVAGLRELKRVCQPDGHLFLLEHVRPGNRILGLLFDWLNPFVVRMMGANINRRTLDNVKNAGWRIKVAEPLLSDIIWWVEALPE